MPTSIHTRRMATVPLLAGASLLAACASSGSGPIYELRPTAVPLTYVLSSEGSNDIETPAGSQGATYSSEATLVLEIGEELEGGRSFVVTVESFSFETGGDFGAMSDDLTETVAGKPFRGVISPEGGVTFTESPQFSKGSVSTDDLERVVSELLFPLPPGGDPSVGSWPHRVNLAVGSGLEGTSVYDGEMTVAGDTVWNGIPATLMVSEGTVTIEATGQPAGAPAEIELANEVAARTVYVWDPARGVLLQVRATGSGGGDISTMGFSMPMAVFSETVVTLQP